MSEAQPIHPLIARLYELARTSNRAALATLRRSLNEGSQASAFPVVAPFFGKKTRRGYENALVLVASLFALHPMPGQRSLASALRKLARDKSSESIEGRFVALLNSHVDDLGEHLRHAVTLVRSSEIAIDWNDLLRTILGWENEWVRRRWARDFWGAVGNDETHQGSTQETDA